MTPMLLNYCGKLVPGDSPLFTAHSRLVKYGYGLFETIRCTDETPIMLEKHHERLLNGMALLEMNNINLSNCQQVKESIIELLQANETRNAVVRIQVFQLDGGISEQGETGFLISIQDLPQLSSARYLKAGLFRNAVKATDTLANLKHSNYLPYALAASYARQQLWDDAILLNQHGRVCDSSIANVFAIRQNIIHTPLLNEGCVAGVYRRFLLEVLPNMGYEIRETTLEEEFLSVADEIFLTNAVRGIQPVNQFGNRPLPVSFGKMIIKDLEKAGYQ